MKVEEGGREGEERGREGRREGKRDNVSGGECVKLTMTWREGESWRGGGRESGRKGVRESKRVSGR